jgi:dCTP deaminase
MLARPEILEALSRSTLADRLVITPLLDPSQISTSSVDLRLGFSFLLAKRANVPAIDPMSGPAFIVGEKLFEKITVSRGRKIFLHPREFVIGATVEYLGLPGDIGGYVTSRSSWGRAGLVIATATAVAPGFRGVITLELANLGTAPVVLRPGVRIAQIIFHRSQKQGLYQGRYRFPTEPEAGKMHLDDDLKFWVPKSD